MAVYELAYNTLTLRQMLGLFLLGIVFVLAFNDVDFRAFSSSIAS